jgi:hypothetical protein
LAVLLGVQLSLVAVTFPVGEVLTAQPLFYIDAAYHWYNMTLSANLAETGNLVGYDPFFAGGHVNGVHYYLSGRLSAQLAALFPAGLDEMLLYKIYVFVCAVLSPLAIFAAAKVVGFRAREASIAAVLGLALWWVSYFHWYYTAGMVAYVASAYLGVLFVTLVVRYLERGGAWWIPPALGALGAFGFFWHPLFPILVAFPTSAYLVLNLRRLQAANLFGVLVVVPAISLLPNIPWLYATYLYREDYIGPTVQAVVDPALLWQELLGIVRGNAHGSKVYALLVLATAWAVTRPSDAGHRRLSVALLVAAIATEVFAYLGAAIPGVASIQPNRFAPAGYLLLCLPAAHGIGLIWSRSVERGARAARMFAAACCAAVLLIGLVLIWEVWREATPGEHGRYGASPPQVMPLGDTSAWVLGWLEARTTPDARVLFETALSRVHDQAHLAGYYAYRSQREFIGGPYPQMHFAGAWDGRAFGKALGEISVERMSEYLELYNIGWILVYSDAAKRYFDAFPGARFDSEYGRLRAYAVDRSHSYFVSGGTGRVRERDHNHLLITDIVGSEIVLKYHYVPGLVTEPPVELSGERLLDDPTPFIRIADPPAQLRIYIP